MNRATAAVWVTVWLGVLVACTTPAVNRDTTGTWVGTITTEGNVTTVVNETGSVWGGTARLVEEASIGVDEGPTEYMLGEPGYLYADDDRLYVIQWNVPTLRVYDHDGAHQLDVGTGGQGPGEYSEPTLVAADDAGSIFVYDDTLKRVNVYDREGITVGTWPVENGACCRWPLVTSLDGRLRVPVHRFLEDRLRSQFGVQTFDDEGAAGPVSWHPIVEYEASTITVAGSAQESVPFAVRFAWAVTPTGMVAGVPSEYRFEQRVDNGDRVIVEKYWSPVAVHPEEAAWFRARTEAALRELLGKWEWQGDDVPPQKPAYDWFIPAASGETWVQRSTEGQRIEDCSEPADGYLEAWANPCWISDPIFDVFDTDGRYLGEVEAPERLVSGVPSSLFVRGDLVLAAVEDAAGTIMVKRYRLVLPGEEEQ